MQIEGLSLQESIRTMRRLNIDTYTLSRHVGVYELVVCKDGKFFVKEKFKAIQATEQLPLAWLDGDNWTLCIGNSIQQAI